MTNKPRPHADIIRAWADGAEVQYRAPNSTGWVDAPDPAFVADYEYRVKPAREYPKLDVDEINRLASYFCLQPGTIDLVSRRALQYMVDAGQVVTREEFIIAIGNRATRDERIAKAIAAVIHMPTAWQDIVAIIGEVKP